MLEVDGKKGRIGGVGVQRTKEKEFPRAIVAYQSGVKKKKKGVCTAMPD